MPEQHGPVALVTGGSSGIGLSVVTKLAGRGYTVYATGRDRARWDAAVKADSSLGAVKFRAVPMRDHEGLARLVDEIDGAGGGLDVLVNNAGIMPVGQTHEVAPESVAEQIDVLMHAPILLTQAALRVMLKAGRGGAIVTVSSTVAHMASPRIAVYAAAKAGIEHFTKSVAAEYAAQGIRANVVCPGGVDTNLADRTVMAAIARSTPLKRLARPDEIASLIMYVLNPEASYITGSSFTIDGGTSLGRPPEHEARHAAKPSGHAPAPQPRAPAAVAPCAAPAAAAPAPRTRAPAATDSGPFGKIAGVMARIFACDASEITPQTIPDDIEKWDSLGHMNLVAALEKECGVTFQVDEVMEMTSVQAIVDVIARKTDAR